MDSQQLFEKYLAQLTNNPDLTDAILQLFTAAGDANELLMKSLAQLCGYELAEFVMQLHDTAFGNDPALCIDPSYEDATVETEARPKLEKPYFIQEIHSTQNLGNMMRDHHRWQHIRKFNPLLEKELVKIQNMSENDRLIYLTAQEMNQRFKSPTQLR